MFIEFACHNKILMDDAKTEIFKCIDLGVQGISVPIIFLSKIAAFIPDNVLLSCPIDYPNGYGDTELRSHYTIRASHNGAKAVDIIVNTFLFYNQEKEFLNDLKAVVNTAQSKDMIPRIMIDYKKLVSPEDFSVMLRLLSDLKVEYLFCSNGLYSEDPIDNIILCNIAQKDHGFSSIANGNFYLKDHLDKAKKAKLYGARFNNSHALERCLNGV